MTDRPDFLTLENKKILDLRRAHLADESILPWLRSCKIRVLLVADGDLDFGAGDFGLSTFVTTLLDTRRPARFEVTLAHLANRSGASMLAGEARIKDRIANFKFDDPENFATDRYDVVFLFGIATSMSRTGKTAAGTDYPTDRLADTELQLLAEFQNGGGGLFATGDHGALGRFMGQALPRARGMRLWAATSPNPDLDEVSMAGKRRNDTNRRGDPGSQFDDQSDDIPQQIQPRIYTSWSPFVRYRYPHPLLCGPNGIIRVMPDHPHEGQCTTPTDVDRTLAFTAPAGPEFPPATDGGARPLPEVISHNLVLAGTTSGGKQPTESHTFGGIAAYDGHRAGIGRVATDSTWHHFININLVGDIGNPDPIKSVGFLASAAGQQHLENIKSYYRNLAVWLSRPDNLWCINHSLILRLVKEERVLEAVLTTAEVGFEKIATPTLAVIGGHARDVLGKYASRCQTRKLVIDLVRPDLIPRIPEIDPWFRPKDPVDPAVQFADGEITWLNLEAALDVAFGAALVHVNDHLDLDRDEIDDDEVGRIAQAGARRGVELALRSLDRAIASGRSRLKL